MMSCRFGFGLLAMACIALTSGAAIARTAFDGNWSVVIVTDRGDCDRASRYGVRIVDGYLAPEASGFDLQGRVAPNGTLRAVISAGDESATGFGRLTRTTGNGVWRGRGDDGYCAGTWEAERRG